MKKILITLCLVLILSSCGAPSMVSLEKPLYNYELDTFMENSEIYEFIPKGDPSKLCVVFILDNLTSTSMQCFDREVEKE